ncbi:MAG: translational GTPase TypA [Clostridia bacterium]|nr:translational GTPase TypA [Clostridia bacterium]
MGKREDIRNVAIIAHVDHGKTTLVDVMLKQSGTFRDNEQTSERMMDSNDLERERGITILSKNTSIHYKDTKINIVDTPGHADFGGEVERVLKMVDGVLLLVDAFEGPMPQTKFVLSKALKLNLKPIVVINKIDKPNARPLEVVDQVLDLFIELDANDDQLDFPVIFVSGKTGVAKTTLEDSSEDLKPLFDIILEKVPCPDGDIDGALQVLVSNIDYDDYIGRIAVGRIERGTVKNGQNIVLCGGKENVTKNAKIGKLFTFSGLKRVEIEEAKMGDIVAFSGIADVNIGDTVCAPECVEPLPFVNIDEPTVSITIGVNNSPFAGREGEFVTSRHIRDRLFREVQTNLSLKVEETDAADTFKVSGRGELHLSVLLENMRREGFEMVVSRPNVIYKDIDGVKCEPMEHLVIDVPEEHMGVVMEKLGLRKAEMVNMAPGTQGYTRMEFKVPSRGLIGYRSEFMTDTKGTGIMNHLFDGYEPVKGEINSRLRGVLVAFEAGEATTYGLYNAEERGELFIGAGVEVYEGMIVGINAKNEDVVVNVCKKKHLTNMRASGSDEALRLSPPRQISLEQALEFIAEDELVEITPKNIRLRKKILNKEQRMKFENRK